VRSLLSHQFTRFADNSFSPSLERVLHWHINGKQVMTGLPEYRNGGLLIDLGFLTLDASAVLSSLSLPPGSELPPLPASHPAIVEWRALTVIALDKIAQGVNEKLGAKLTLAQVLESCTWKGVRYSFDPIFCVSAH
jgi:hypothetical protein